MAMERVTVEQNGELITLEVPEGTSDADIQSFLTPQATPASSKGAGDLAATAVQTAATAGLSMGETGVAELAKAGVNAAKPFVQAAAGPTAAIYKAHPILAPAIDLAGMATMGVPPVAASQGAMGLYDKYKGAVEAGKEVGKFTSQGDLFTSPTTGSTYPETVPAFREMQKANPALSQKLSDLYNSGGGNNAVKSWLAGPEGQAAMRDPRFAAAAETYMGKVPGMGAQAMRVAGPIARGAVKAAGPVGMALNMYDAYPYLEQARTNAQPGDVGQRINQAQQMGRTGYNVGYQGPQINAQQAQNVLQSGSPRDIQYFGGQDSLRDQMRKKAAARVTGPAIPGQQ